MALIWTQASLIGQFIFVGLQGSRVEGEIQIWSLIYCQRWILFNSSKNFQVYSATHHCHAGHRKATESRIVVRFPVGFLCTLCHIHLTAANVCVKWTEKILILLRHALNITMATRCPLNMSIVFFWIRCPSLILAKHRSLDKWEFIYHCSRYHVKISRAFPDPNIYVYGKAIIRILTLRAIQLVHE